MSNGFFGPASLCGFLAGFAFAGLTASSAMAQERPNFSGKWASPSNPETYITLTQDGSTFTVARGEVDGTYQLDGSESRNTMRAGGQTVSHVSQARWVSNALVIITRTTVDMGSRSYSYDSLTTYSFVADGSGYLSVTTLGPTLGLEPWTVTTTRIYWKR